MVERIYLILGDSIVAFQKKLWYSATGIPYFEVTSPKTISLKPKREMKSKIPKKSLEMIAQRRDKTTPGSFLAGVLTHGIFYDSRRILKGPWYSYSNYLNRFLFFSLSVCLSEVIFTWHFRVHGQLNFPRKKTTVRVNLRIFRLSLQLKLSLKIELT